MNHIYVRSFGNVGVKAEPEGFGVFDCTTPGKPEPIRRGFATRAEMQRFILATWEDRVSESSVALACEVWRDDLAAPLGDCPTPLEQWMNDSKLTRHERRLVNDDFRNAQMFESCGFEEYERRIGRENLKAYAKSLDASRRVVEEAPAKNPHTAHGARCFPGGRTIEVSAAHREWVEYATRALNAHEDLKAALAEMNRLIADKALWLAKEGA